MSVYSVGPDNLNEWDLKDLEKTQENYQWVVYWYQYGGYDGSGEAVALDKDGLLHCKNLSHCSCFGPMEGWPGDVQVMTVETFFEPKENIFDYDCKEAIKEKIKTLVE